MSERLQYGIAVVMSSAKYKTKQFQNRARLKALKQFFDTGGRGHTAGVRLIGRWRNPDRAIARDWRTTEQSGQSLEDFYNTLHGGRGALRELQDRVNEEWEQLERTSPSQSKKRKRKTTYPKASRKAHKTGKRKAPRLARKTAAKKPLARRKSRSAQRKR